MRISDWSSDVCSSDLFHFVIANDEQLAELPRYIRDLGVPTAKLFMNIRGDEGKRLGLPGTDDGSLFRLLAVLRDNGGMLCPHPQNIEAAWVLRARVVAADPKGRAELGRAACRAIVCQDG